MTDRTEATRPVSRKKRGPGFYLKSLISIALIVYIFHRVGLENVWQQVRQARPDLLALSLAITPVLVWVSAWKWQIILRAQKIRMPLIRLFWLYIVGYFFNTVLPTNVGGDVVRAYALGKSTGKNAQAFSSVFVERFTGLTVLLFMALVAFFVAIRELWDPRLTLALVVCVLGYITLLVLVLTPRLLRWVSSCLKISVIRKIFTKLQAFQDAILELRHAPGVLVVTILNSFLFYGVAVLNVYVSSHAFHAQMSIQDAFILTPIILVITMIPISVGGIGLSESAYVFGFSRMGLVGAVGLSVALFMRIKALLAGAVGGLYYSSMEIRIENKDDSRTEERGPEDVRGVVNYYSGFEDVMRQKRSPLGKYQDIAIGTNRFWTLIKYEFLITFFSPIPGLLGLASRQVLYRTLFRTLGKGTAIGKSVTLRHPGKIDIGKQCVIDEYCSLSAQGDENSGIQLGEQVLLGRGTVLSTRNGTIEIGAFSNIGANCRLGTTTRIRLGHHVLFAANCYVGGAQHRFDRTDIPIMRQGYESKGGVVIEDDVWLGAGVTILDGVRIGTGSVVGAGSVVTKDLPSFSVAVGSPARVVFNRKEPQHEHHS
jgi:uncharacterized protein (TIRG00374 family)